MHGNQAKKTFIVQQVSTKNTEFKTKKKEHKYYGAQRFEIYLGCYLILGSATNTVAYRLRLLRGPSFRGYTCYHYVIVGTF